jgi:hypothetical protein
MTTSAVLVIPAPTEYQIRLGLAHAQKGALIAILGMQNQKEKEHYLPFV